MAFLNSSLTTYRFPAVSARILTIFDCLATRACYLCAFDTSATFSCLFHRSAFCQGICHTLSADFESHADAAPNAYRQALLRVCSKLSTYQAKKVHFSHSGKPVPDEKGRKNLLLHICSCSYPNLEEITNSIHGFCHTRLGCLLCPQECLCVRLRKNTRRADMARQDTRLLVRNMYHDGFRNVLQDENEHSFKIRQRPDARSSE